MGTNFTSALFFLLSGEVLTYQNECVCYLFSYKVGSSALEIPQKCKSVLIPNNFIAGRPKMVQ